MRIEWFANIVSRRPPLPRLPRGTSASVSRHSFRFELALGGSQSGDRVPPDFADIDVIRRPCSTSSTTLLNEVRAREPDLGDPRALALERIKPKLEILQAVTVAETCDARCTYRGK